MELTNQQVLNALGALRELGQKETPVATSVHIVRLNRALKAPADDIEAVRLKIVAEHGAKDEHGNARTGAGGQTLFDDEAHRVAAQAQYDELMALTCEVEAMPLRQAELGTIQVRGVVLEALGPLFVLDEEATP
jgi:hypothetical protein